MSPVFRHEQTVTAPPERVVAFFHDAANLPQVSPRWPRLDVLGPDTRVRPGAEIRVRLRAGPVDRTFLTRILRVGPGGMFTDRIEGGPFVRWEHTHRFEPLEGGTRIVDEIDYTASGGADLLVPLALRGLFAIRRRRVRQVFR